MGGDFRRREFSAGGSFHLVLGELIFRSSGYRYKDIQKNFVEISFSCKIRVENIEVGPIYSHTNDIIIPI